MLLVGNVGCGAKNRRHLLVASSSHSDRAARLAAIPAGEKSRQQRCYGAAARMLYPPALM